MSENKVTTLKFSIYFGTIGPSKRLNLFTPAGISTWVTRAFLQAWTQKVFLEDRRTPMFSNRCRSSSMKERLLISPWVHFRRTATSWYRQRFDVKVSGNCWRIGVTWQWRCNRVSFLVQQYGDVHLPAALLKSFLRQLPEPIMTFDLYDHTVRVQCEYQLHVAQRWADRFLVCLNRARLFVWEQGAHKLDPTQTVVCLFRAAVCHTDLMTRFQLWRTRSGWRRWSAFCTTSCPTTTTLSSNTSSTSCRRSATRCQILNAECCSLSVLPTRTKWTNEVAHALFVFVDTVQVTDPHDISFSDFRWSRAASSTRWLLRTWRSCLVRTWCGPSRRYNMNRSHKCVVKHATMFCLNWVETTRTLCKSTFFRSHSWRRQKLLVLYRSEFSATLAFFSRLPWRRWDTWTRVLSCLSRTTMTSLPSDGMNL